MSICNEGIVSKYISGEICTALTELPIKTLDAQNFTEFIIYATSTIISLLSLISLFLLVWRLLGVFTNALIVFISLIDSFVDAIGRSASGFRGLSFFEISLIVLGAEDPKGSLKESKVGALHQSAAIAVLCATVMAFFSMSIVVSEAEGFKKSYPELIAIIPVVWAVVIFSFDRALVGYSAGGSLGGVVNSSLLVSRVIVAALVSLSVSLPMEVAAFSREVDDVLRTSLRVKAETYAADISKAENAGYKSALEDYEEKRDSLDDEVKAIKENPPHKKTCLFATLKYCEREYEASCNWEKMPDECEGVFSPYPDCHPGRASKSGARTRWEKADESYSEAKEECDKATKAFNKKISSLEKSQREIHSPEEVRILVRLESSSEGKCAGQTICYIQEEKAVFVNVENVGFFDRAHALAVYKRKSLEGLDGLDLIRVKHMFFFIFFLIEMMPAMLSILLSVETSKRGGKT